MLSRRPPPLKRGRSSIDSTLHAEHATNGGAEARRVLAVVGLCLGLFFFQLGARPLWNQDEGMHAATSKDMVVSGDWVTPTLNGEPFFDKPALHNWLVALAFTVLGFTEFAARLPSALLGLGCVLVTYELGRRLYGPRTGTLGAVVLATAGQFFVLSRTVMHDISLSFFVTLGLALWYAGYQLAGRGRHFLLLSYAAFGFAALAKGPLGVLVPGAIVFLFLAIRKDLRFLGGMSLGWGVLIGLAIAAPWYLAVSLRNPGYAHYFFVELNFGSFLSQQSHHPEPVTYYLPTLITGFIPWSVFLPVALVRSWRRGREDAHGGDLFLLLWAGFFFVFFSLASSKLPTYILPLFPPLAILVGRLWGEVIEAATPGPRRAVLWSFTPFLLLPAAVVHRVVTHPEPLTELAAKYGLALRTAASPVIALLVGLGIALILLWRRRPRASFAGVTLAFVAFIGLFTLFILPVMNLHQSSRDMAHRVDELLPAGEPIACYERMRDSALFYTDRLIRVIRTPEELQALLATDEPSYCIIKSRRYRQLGLDNPVVTEIGDDVLVSNRAGGPQR
jgi:4-amino-4-deoxy-L-arabinose transferase-like glycosyltransferase